MASPDEKYPTDDESHRAVFDHAAAAWPVERGETPPDFLQADSIAREVQTYVEEERRPRPSKLEIVLVVAFVAVLCLGAYSLLLGGTS